MTQYTYTKQVNSSRLVEEIRSAGLSSISHLDTAYLTVLIYFSDELTIEQKSTLDSVVAAHIILTQTEAVAKIIDNAVSFGLNLQKNFVTENVILGITQLGLTGHVRRVLREVKDAIETGSLYDAITEIKNLNVNDFDNAILTPARILTFRNKIETYLNVPLATAWDDDETWL